MSHGARKCRYCNAVIAAPREMYCSVECNRHASQLDRDDPLWVKRDALLLRARRTHVCYECRRSFERDPEEQYGYMGHFCDPCLDLLALEEGAWYREERRRLVIEDPGTAQAILVFNESMSDAASLTEPCDGDCCGGTGLKGADEALCPCCQTWSPDNPWLPTPEMMMERMARSDKERADDTTSFSGRVAQFNDLTDDDEPLPCRGSKHCKGHGMVSLDDRLDDVFDCEYCSLMEGFHEPND